MADIAVQRFTVHLIDPDEVIDVDANRIDLRAWESREQVAWFDAPASLTKVDKLAYLACARTGAFVGTWEDFDARAAAVVSRPDPTRAQNGHTPNGVTDGSLSPSPSGPGTSRPRSKAKAPK